jgi:nitroimidazol reductase NimA-like FMN-containing flavoprotein (pyridoxamine 5'-phosphate oxidase superfamily)
MVYMHMAMRGELDRRFGDSEQALDGETVRKALADAELYWLTTVRKDGRPHVTPLVGLWLQDSFVFCTGGQEQKARNIAHAADVAITTGSNAWNRGLDVVVEGLAQRVTGLDALTELADAYRDKYGDDWDYDADDEVFDPEGNRAFVFRVEPTKVIAFAKCPHGQTTFKPHSSDGQGS